MRHLFILAGVLAVAATLGQSQPVQASETGVAGIHTWQRSGGRTCLVDHFHDGSGSGRTKAAAQAAAIRAWVDFTAWEYGSSWGRWGLAASKSVNCSGGPGNYSCSVSARACRGW
jgi:hypothetical protein